MQNTPQIFPNAQERTSLQQISLDCVIFLSKIVMQFHIWMLCQVAVLIVTPRMAAWKVSSSETLMNCPSVKISQRVFVFVPALLAHPQGGAIKHPCLKQLSNHTDVNVLSVFSHSFYWVGNLIEQAHVSVSVVCLDCCFTLYSVISALLDFHPRP